MERKLGSSLFLYHLGPYFFFHFCFPTDEMAPTMMMRLVLACLLACSVLVTVAHGARLPHSVTITSDDSVLGRAADPYGGDVDNATTQHDPLFIDTLPFSCQQQGCGPVPFPHHSLFLQVLCPNNELGRPPQQLPGRCLRRRRRRFRQGGGQLQLLPVPGHVPVLHRTRAPQHASESVFVSGLAHSPLFFRSRHWANRVERRCPNTFWRE